MIIYYLLQYVKSIVVCIKIYNMHRKVSEKTGGVGQALPVFIAYMQS